MVQKSLKTPLHNIKMTHYAFILTRKIKKINTTSDFFHDFFAPKTVFEKKIVLGRAGN